MLLTVILVCIMLEGEKRNFNEDAAEIRRLVARDSKTFKTLIQSDFAEDAASENTATESGEDMNHMPGLQQLETRQS